MSLSNQLQRRERKIERRGGEGVTTEDRGDKERVRRDEMRREETQEDREEEDKIQQLEVCK